MEQPNTEQQFTEDSSSFDLIKWVMLILTHWYLFVISVVIALGFAYLKNRSWQPSYKSAANVMVESSSRYQNSGPVFMQGFGVQSGYSNIDNQKIMLRSHDFIGRVVDSLPFLKVDYISRGRFKTKNLYNSSPIIIESAYIAPEAYGLLFKIELRNDGTFSITPDDDQDIKPFQLNGKYGEPLQSNLFFITVNNVGGFSGKGVMYFQFRSRGSLIADFSPRLGLNFVTEKSSVMEISLVSETPDRDVDFINKLSEAFLQDNLNKKNDVATKTINFIDEQLGSVSQSLSQSEDDMTKFRQINQIVNVSSYSGDLLAKATDAKNQFETLKLRETYLNFLENYLTTNMEGDSIMAPSSLGWDEPMLIASVQQINELIIRRSGVNKTNPYYEKYTKDIETAKQGVQEAIKIMRASLKIQKDELNKKIKEVDVEIAALPEKELELKAIERKYRVDDNYYTYFLQKRAEAAIQKASNSSDNEILDKARTIFITNSNEQSKTLITSLVIGLLIPLLIVVLKELLNNTIRTTEEVEKTTSFPNIGSVRHTKITNPILATRNPRSSFTEIFRVIRTRIEFIVQRKTNILLLITSTESGDGKTYFSTNLASVYAMTKRKTILVDMDIRNPSVLRQFDTEVKFGVTDYLIDQCSLEQAIVKIEGVDYDILPAGTIPPNPGEIVRSDKLKEMFEILRTKYEYIVMDTSPVGLVADAYSLMSLADINLFIVRQAKTNKTFVKKLAAQLKADKISKIYSILNDVKVDGRGYKYNSGGDYGYGGYGAYGGGYLSKSKKIATRQRKKYYTDEDDI